MTNQTNRLYNRAGSGEESASWCGFGAVDILKGMKMSIVVQKRLALCLVVLILTASCQKQKGSSFVSTDMAVSETEKLVPEEKIPEQQMDVVDVGTQQVLKEFVPKYYTTLIPEDFERLGLKEMASLSEVLEKIPKEIVLDIDKIIINMPSVRSFEGIEQFENLEALQVYNIELEDFRQISKAKNINWLNIENSIIANLNGISDLQKLDFLSLRGSTVSEANDLKSSKSIKTLVLSNVKNYRELIDEMPDTVGALYLEGNNIATLSELDYLKKIPNLRELYIRDNKIPQEELFENPYLGHIKLDWSIP